MNTLQSNPVNLAQNPLTPPLSAAIPQPDLTLQNVPPPVLATEQQMQSSPLLRRIFEESVALALKLLPENLRGQPYESLTDVKIGSFSHNLATGETFRVLCNCATAQPKEHTQRHVAGKYTEHRHPTEDEIRVVLRPRLGVAPAPAEHQQVAHHPV